LNKPNMPKENQTEGIFWLNASLQHRRAELFRAEARSAHLAASAGQSQARRK
jgi:hypothetical protein